MRSINMRMRWQSMLSDKSNCLALICTSISQIIPANIEQIWLIYCVSSWPTPRSIFLCSFGPIFDTEAITLIILRTCFYSLFIVSYLSGGLNANAQNKIHSASITQNIKILLNEGDFNGAYLSHFILFCGPFFSSDFLLLGMKRVVCTTQELSLRKRLYSDSKRAQLSTVRRSFTK